MKLFNRKPRDRVAAVADVLDGVELPTFPGVVTEALARLGDPDSSLTEIADVIALDPGTSARLLQLANSAAVGLRNPVNDLRQVVALLGRNQIESILISAAVRNALPEVRSPVFDSRRFWQAAAQRAVVATAISAELDPARRSEAFTAALLQDMALPVLVDNVEGYDRLLTRWYEGEVTDLARAEHDTFGWSHAAMAGVMAHQWNFPDPLLDSLTEHHDGLHTDTVLWVRLVADWHEVDTDGSRDHLIEAAATVPQLSGLDTGALIDGALEDVDEVSRLFR